MGDSDRGIRRNIAPRIPIQLPMGGIPVVIFLPFYFPPVEEDKIVFFLDGDIPAVESVSGIQRIPHG